MLNVLFAAIAVGLLAATLRTWGVVIRRWSQGLPLVARTPHDPVPWGLLDVALTIALLFIFSGLASVAVDQRFGVTAATPPAALSLAYYRWKVSALALASLATFVMAAGVILVRFRPWLRVSEMLANAWRDLRLGGAAFLVLVPPVYAMQYLLVKWFESKHPIIELLREHPDPGLIVASVVSAVIVAPIFEEFLFRGLLQGWLEKIVTHSGQPLHLILGGSEGSPPGRGKEGAENRATGHQPAERDTSGSENPYAPPVTTDQVLQRSEVNGAGMGVEGYLPILASSVLFAALHFSHGPDWIPLFFLALGLGYLYRQTHRLLPCITVHFLLNSCSMGGFLVELLHK